MVTSMSRRTQITLTDEQYERLQSMVERTGLSMAELIRRAVDDAYRDREADIARRLAGLEASFGAWSHRDDIGDTVEWLQSMRTDPQQRERDLWGDR